MILEMGNSFAASAQPNPSQARKSKKPNFKGWANRMVFLAPRPGLEPGTYGLTVRRSTD